MMKLTQNWPANAPLTDLQSNQLLALAGILTPEQSLWVSGYLAGLAAGQRQTLETPTLNLSTLAAADPQQKLTIVYASETGNARKLATQAGEIATELGLNFRVIDVADFKTRTLRDESHLLIITSTHGEGDPPEPAFSFNEFLFGRKAPTLSGTKFAVLGLGDSSYEFFCKTARSFDEKLEQLGGQRISPRLECDVDYEASASAWLRDTLKAYSADPALRQETRPTVVAAPSLAGALPQAAASPFDQATPFAATVLDHLVLNGRGSSKSTYHIELSLEDSGLVYAPGDAIGVVATNADEAVEEILNTLKLNETDEVQGASGQIPLRAALKHELELTIATPRFLQAYAKVAGSEKLQKLADSDDRAAQFEYLGQRQILDIVAEFPATGITAAEFAAMLRKLTPRLYSLASSQSLLPDEAHLTVAAVKFPGHGRERSGVASGMLGRLAPEDAKVPVYISRNDEFRLPADTDTPLIMVGAGTGVAPYRAFVQEREALEINSPAWLIFGDRNFRTDFLYQTEWQQFLKDGYLSRMDVAFSRDSRDGNGKTYVQHRMLEQAHDIYDWLERGAHFYVCGDAASMAPDVHEALINIVSTAGQKSREDAEEYVSALRAEKRYRRDVY